MNYRLLIVFLESIFFFENLGIGIIIGLFFFIYGLIWIEFFGGDLVFLCILNLVVDFVGC